MAYEVIILYHLHKPWYFVGTFTEYPYPSPDISSVWATESYFWGNI